MATEAKADQTDDDMYWILGLEEGTKVKHETENKTVQDHKNDLWSFLKTKCARVEMGGFRLFNGTINSSSAAGFSSGLFSFLMSGTNVDQDRIRSDYSPARARARARQVCSSSIGRHPVSPTLRREKVRDLGCMRHLRVDRRSTVHAGQGNAVKHNQCIAC